MAVYTVNFGTMLDQLASNLEVERPDSFQTDTDLKRFINLGVIEMAKRTKVVHVTKFLNLSASVARYTCPTEWLYGEHRQVLFLRSGSLSGAQYQIKKMDRRGFQAVTPAANTSILSSIYYEQPGTGNPQFYLLDGDVIEFRPIPAAALSHGICFKFPGIPDAMVAVSAVPNIPLEYRMVPVIYATYLGQLRDKDPRAQGTLNQFIAECAEARAITQWADMEDPPSIQPEERYHASYWSIV